MNYQDQLNAIIRCPISGEIMDNPVVTPQGRVYDRKALVDYLNANASKAPRGEEINLETINTSLRPNHRLKKLIQDFERLDTPTEEDYQQFVEAYKSGVEQERQIIAALDDFFIKVAGCPITGRLMEDPVITPDGRCYEREALEQYLADNNQHTPEKVEIPSTSLLRRELIVSNKQLQLEINNFRKEMPARINQSAMLAHYLNFFNRIAYDKVVFEVIEDPAILTANPDKDNQISGGITGIATWSNQSLQPSSELYDPVAGGNLPHVFNRKYQLFAYETLQNALVALKEDLIKARVEETSLVTGDDNDLGSNWENLFSVTGYEPYEYETQAPGKFPSNSIMNTLKRLPLHARLFLIAYELGYYGHCWLDDVINGRSRLAPLLHLAFILPTLVLLASVAAGIVGVLTYGVAYFADCVTRIFNPEKYDKSLSPNRARWTAAKQAGVIIASLAVVSLAAAVVPYLGLAGVSFSILLCAYIGLGLLATAVAAKISEKTIREAAIAEEINDMNINPVEQPLRELPAYHDGASRSQATTAPYLLWRNTETRQQDNPEDLPGQENTEQGPRATLLTPRR